jgi:hypothetical protein
MPADEGRHARRRPTPVTILAGIQVVTAIMFGVVAAALLVDPGQAILAISGVTVEGDLLGAEATALAVMSAGVAVLELMAAVALLRLSRLGWTLTMLLAGASLATQIVTFWSTGEVLTLSMLLSVATVLYLNQRPVRVAFELTDRRRGDLEEERG